MEFDWSVIIDAIPALMQGAQLIQTLFAEMMLRGVGKGAEHGARIAGRGDGV